MDRQNSINDAFGSYADAAPAQVQPIEALRTRPGEGEILRDKLAERNQIVELAASYAPLAMPDVQVLPPFDQLNGTQN